MLLENKNYATVYSHAEPNAVLECDITNTNSKDLLTIHTGPMYAINNEPIQKSMYLMHHPLYTVGKMT